MILQYSFCHYRKVMSVEYVFDSGVQFMSLEYSLCPYIALCVPRVSL